MLYFKFDLIIEGVPQPPARFFFSHALVSQKPLINHVNQGLSPLEFS